MNKNLLLMVLGLVVCASNLDAAPKKAEQMTATEKKAMEGSWAAKSGAEKKDHIQVAKKGGGVEGHKQVHADHAEAIVAAAGN